MSAAPQPQVRAGARSPSRASSPSASASASRPEPKILFQTFVKSVGPRTYVSQVKESSNGNHFLVLTEGKRDEKTDEVRKTRLFIFSEDFGPFFRMLHETAQFIKANPVPEEVRKKRQAYWSRQAGQARNSPSPTETSAQPQRGERRGRTGRAAQGPKGR